MGFLFALNLNNMMQKWKRNNAIYVIKLNRKKQVYATQQHITSKQKRLVNTTIKTVFVCDQVEHRLILQAEAVEHHCSSIYTYI